MGEVECNISKTSVNFQFPKVNKKDDPRVCFFRTWKGDMDCDRENPSPFSMCPMVTRTAIASTMRTIGD